MDEDGYRKPLLARRRRVETRASLIPSHNAIHDGLFAGLFIVSTVIVQFHSGCALTIIEGLGKSWGAYLKNGVCMMRAVAEHTTPNRNARKAWHSCLYATGAYVSDCRQVVKLASLVVSFGGYRPPTNATSQCFAWKGHTGNTTCSCPHSLSGLSGADGAAREARDGSQLTTWTHNVSSWYAVITEPSSVVC